MDDQHLSPSLAGLPDLVVPVLRRVYDNNAGRHDVHVGDDAVTFGSAIYRNSWFQLEQAFAERVGWSTGRPDGSLAITNADFRIHVYRWGHDEHTDLEAFRLDDAPASLTKRAIALANSAQLTLIFDETEDAEPNEELATPSILHELVIVHAGNADDGCCGIWVGAPLAVEETIASPWAWIEPLWLIERPEVPAAVTGVSDQQRHDELPEPELDIRLAEDEGDSDAGEA